MAISADFGLADRQPSIGLIDCRTRCAILNSCIFNHQSHSIHFSKQNLSESPLPTNRILVLEIFLLGNDVCVNFRLKRASMAGFWTVLLIVEKLVS